MRRVLISLALALLVAAGTGTARAGAPAAQAPRTAEFVVLYAEGVPTAAARAAIAAAGATIVRENTAVGVATVRTSRGDFAAVAGRQAALAGVARSRAIGVTPAGNRQVRKTDPAEAAARERARASTPSASAKRPRPRGHADPLSGLQWDMQQIGATAGGSYRVERGDHRVKVAILDSGIDGSHPDIAPNFDRALSRSFTVDIPVDANGAVIDGPCEDEPDRSCNDPADVDENGHGTHVASAIGSPLNGLGMAGVAPGVTLVNLRAAQDSGFVFLQPVVDALVYAGDHGIDVANMSFFIDPWFFNCTANPADPPEDQAEQRAIRTATQRAIDYARARGVTMFASANNQFLDPTKPQVDDISPDFADEPGEAPRVRDIDPATCDVMPSEARGVIAVTATGISTRKAYYSNFGLGYADVAAPGGDDFDTPDNTFDVTRQTLAAYPESIARANGEIDEDGVPLVDYVVRDCKGRTCAYYQYLLGTSMASPRAAGVGALIVSRFGVRDHRHGGLTLNPAVTEAVLRRTATDHACPDPPLFTYTIDLGDGTVLTFTALCEGPARNNGFYGDGIVNALRAVGGHRP